MATLKISSPNEEVTNFHRIEVGDTNIEFTDVYWTDKQGKRIEEIIPESKAVLRIESKGFKAGEKLTVTLKHQSGKPIKGKREITEKVKVGKDGTASKGFDWKQEDTIIATIKAANGKEKAAEPLVKHWGIWLNPGSGDLHRFDPINGYSGLNQHINDFYEAYFYLIQSETARGAFNSYSEKRNDVYVEFIGKKDHRNEFVKNGSANKYPNSHQLVGSIRWNTRMGLDFPDPTKGSKKRIRSSAAIALIHEVGHSMAVNLFGLQFFKDSSDGKAPIKGFKNLEEYRVMTDYENLVIDELNEEGCDEGKRPDYNSINLGHLKRMSTTKSITLENELK